jgi:hypothetical protein
LEDFAYYLTVGGKNKQKFFRGLRKAQSAECRANIKIDAMRCALCAVRLPPWSPKANKLFIPNIPQPKNFPDGLTEDFIQGRKYLTGNAGILYHFGKYNGTEIGNRRLCKQFRMF